MNNQGESEISDMQQSERVNPFSPFGAPGFDMKMPLQFRLFDPQICGEFQDDWLADAVESHGITRPELDAMIAGKLLRRWKNRAGKEGSLQTTSRG
jgi:hypothetical protein